MRSAAALRMSLASQALAQSSFDTSERIYPPRFAYKRSVAARALVAATPFPLDPPPPTNARNQNASSPLAISPFGPTDFHAFAVHQTTPIRRDAVFMTALGLLAQQARFDFYGQLSQPQIIFRDRSFSPRISIAVAAPRPDQRVLRAHVFWGIAQILHHMIVGHEFTGSTWRLSLRGREVGTIFFGVGGQQLGAAGDEKKNDEIGTAALSSAQPIAFLEPVADPTTTAAVSDSNVPITLRFQFWGNLMSMESVFMGAVAALIELAHKPDGATWDVFAASFLGYLAFWTWYSPQVVRGEASRMKKEVLVLCVVASVRHALREGDWRALRVDVAAQGERPGIIAWGGYADFVEKGVGSE